MDGEIVSPSNNLCNVQVLLTIVSFAFTFFSSTINYTTVTIYFWFSLQKTSSDIDMLALIWGRGLLVSDKEDNQQCGPCLPIASRRGVTSSRLFALVAVLHCF